MQFNNYSPFAGIAWESVDAHNRYSAAVVARVKYKLIKNTENKNSKTQEWRLLLDSDQGALFSSDVYHSETATSSVRYESDFVDFKPHCDLVLNAKTYAPDNTPARSWVAGVEVYDEKNRLSNALHLNIKGFKQRTQLGPIWTNPLRDKIQSLNICYEYAYGGNILKEDEEGNEISIASEPYNPVGCGIKKLNNPSAYIQAPQISYASKAYKNIPAGFGVINRAWKSRVEKAGTYDEAWIEKQHPLPPHDFNPEYNQCAHSALVIKEYPKAKSKIVLHNILKEQSEHFFKLPQLQLYSRVRVHTGDIYTKMNLDTIVVDVDSDNEEEYALYLSYRSLTKLTQEVECAEILLKANSEKETDSKLNLIAQSA